MAQKKAATARSRRATTTATKSTGGGAQIIDLQSRRVLTAEDIVAVKKADLLAVEIPELGQAGEPAPVVYYKRLTAGAVLDFVADQESPETKRDAMLVLVSQQVTDKNGKPLFPTTEDAERLRDTRVDVFNRISEALMKGLVKDGEAGKGASAAEGQDADSRIN